MLHMVYMQLHGTGPGLVAHMHVMMSGWHVQQRAILSETADKHCFQLLVLPEPMLLLILQCTLLCAVRFSHPSAQLLQHAACGTDV
jgi:hypothetical protein